MCRWLGIADVVLRGPEKGGKSAGIVDNVLTDAALEHPWFSRLARELPDRRRLKILDNRLYDLIPPADGLPSDVVGVSCEALGVCGPPGDALTAIEVARDRSGVMPRILGVNHHPEIVNRSRQLTILKKRMERGAVTPEWYAERAKALTETIADERGDQWLHLTSGYMFLGPLRYHLYRQIRLRAERLGVRPTSTSAARRFSRATLREKSPRTREGPTEVSPAGVIYRPWPVVAVQLGTKRLSREGIRLGTVRHLPRA